MFLKSIRLWFTDLHGISSSKVHHAMEWFKQRRVANHNVTGGFSCTMSEPHRNTLAAALEYGCFTLQSRGQNQALSDQAGRTSVYHRKCFIWESCGTCAVLWEEPTVSQDEAAVPSQWTAHPDERTGRVWPVSTLLWIVHNGGFVSGCWLTILSINYQNKLMKSKKYVFFKVTMHKTMQNWHNKVLNA